MNSDQLAQRVLELVKDRAEAEDALDLLNVEYEPLPAVVEMEDALKADAPILHQETNVADTLMQDEGDPAVIDGI